MVSERERGGPPRGGGAGKIAIFAAKFLLTGACFWYVSRQIDWGEALAAIPLFEFWWVAFVVIIIMLQIPLVALRWSNILAALVRLDERPPSSAMVAITAICVFRAQIIPSVMGEGVRAWLLVRRGCAWRSAIASVLIDRGVGVGLLIAFGFVVLLLPSSFTALGGYRDLVLMLYGALLLVGGVGLLLVPVIAPLFERWRASRWAASLACDARSVLLGPRADSGHVRT